jgi:GGDEF domain-containing protein
VSQIWTILCQTLRDRPVVLLPALAPVLSAIVAVLVAPAVHIIVAIAVAVIVAVPGVAIAWGSGLAAGTSQEQVSRAFVHTARQQLQKRRQTFLQDDGSLLYADWYFALRFEEEIQRAKRYGQPLSLLVFAPSGLRHKNGLPDRLGLAQALRQRLRSSDVPGPLSDDEVAIALPNTGVRRAGQARRRLQPVGARFGYSIGTATLVADATDREGLTAAALADIQQRQRRRRAA